MCANVPVASCPSSNSASIKDSFTNCSCSCSCDAGDAVVVGLLDVVVLVLDDDEEESSALVS
jgi:hypothetical protein